MTRYPRLLLAALAAVAAAPPARAAEVDPLLPKEAEQVIFINFKQLLGCDLVTRLMVPKVTEAMKKGEAEAVIETLGIDPFKDITDVTIALWEQDAKGLPPADADPAKPPPAQPDPAQPTQPGGQRPRPPGQNVVAVVRGKFDPRKLWKAAGEFTTKYPDRVAIVTENGLKMVKAGDRDRPLYVLVADEKTVLAATSPEMLADTLKAKTTKAKAGLNRELAALVLRQDAKASMFICQLLEGKLARSPLNRAKIPGVDGESFTEQLDHVLSFSMTARVGQDIGLEVRAGMKNADAAEGFGVTVGKLLDLARTFMPVLALRQPKSALLTEDIAKTVKHEVKKSDVVVTVKLSPEGLASALAEDQ